ncbi:MAG TPA: dipeptidase [Anaerolineales bacterium]|nr:dipeptidase [Anaerolineales bacterium]
MTQDLDIAIKFAQEHAPSFVEELNEFLRIPSISTDPERKADMQKAADWVAGRLIALGVRNVQVLPTGGHPVVYGESRQAGEGAPTVLIYGHYDVQPDEPVELWESGPFAPEARGDNLYARGVTDMKGQIMAVLKALEAIQSSGSLPVNVKFLIEGEEEIGSPNLGQFIQKHKDLLACDFALNPDGGILRPDLPTITYALRGLAYFEVRLYGPAHDLHSGVFGGVVHNPAQVLCELIAGMHDEQGRVTLPGFYDKVRHLDREERQELNRLPVDEGTILGMTGAHSLWGEAGYTHLERTGARPTLEVNGLLSGFTGEGSKTVLPARAMAKISCRLVPDQHPDEVHQQLLAYLETKAPKTVRYEVSYLASSPASISDRGSTYVGAMEKAMQAVWGVRPIFRREGGTVPVVAMFQEYLGVESVNAGFGLPDDNMHGPNEKLHLPTWRRGIETFIRFFLNLVEG